MAEVLVAVLLSIFMLFGIAMILLPIVLVSFNGRVATQQEQIIRTDCDTLKRMMPLLGDIRGCFWKEGLRRTTATEGFVILDTPQVQLFNRRYKWHPPTVDSGPFALDTRLLGDVRHQLRWSENRVCTRHLLPWHGIVLYDTENGILYFRLYSGSQPDSRAHSR